MIEMYLKLPVHEGLSHCLDALLHVELENDLSTEDDSSEKSSNGKLLLLYTYTNIHVNIRACLNTQINQIEKLSSFKVNNHTNILIFKPGFSANVLNNYL
jgi:hypothetical protein